MSDALVLAIELLGVVAFAVSGALTAIEREMDLYGIVVLGIVTSVGGGVIRDLVLGITPPATFRDPVYALTALGVSLVTFIPAVRKLFFKQEKIYRIVILILDTLGLALFTVSGVRTAFYHSQANNIFLLLFVGVITGTGGSILRDVLSGLRPYVFTKHFYAMASLIGAGACIALWHLVGQTVAVVGGVVVVIVLRFLAARFRWGLPRAQDLEKPKRGKRTEPEQKD